MPLSNILSETWETIWQSSLVKLPRAVPTAALRYTSPEGPHPYILDLPSRDFGSHAVKGASKRTIPCYIFLPPLTNLANTVPDSTRAPAEAAGPEQRRVALPVLLDFHGGGFFMGSCLEQAPFCAFIARTLNCVVISVDYRMAPLDKFPAAVHDAEDVLNCLLDPAAPGARELAQSIEVRCAQSLARDTRSRSRRGSRSRPSSRNTSRNASPSKSARASNENIAPPGTANSNTTTSGNTLKVEDAVTGQKVPLAKTKSRDPSPFRRRRARTSDAEPPPLFTLDRTRVGVCGFSSGGNLALNSVVSVPGNAPHMADAPQNGRAWPSPFPNEYAHAVPVLLFYPAVDLRQLPSERILPSGLAKGEGLWARLSDNLAPAYVPRANADHWRASPGLADMSSDLHPAARVLLVLPELDNLADQNEQWAKRVEEAGRGKHLQVERFLKMKHGWTQFPEGFLDEQQRKTRTEAFDKTVDFLRGCWYDGSRVD